MPTSRAAEASDILTDLAPLAPLCPGLAGRRVTSPAAAQAVDPDRGPDKYDRTINHVMVQYARKLHEHVELAWHEYADIHEQAAEGNPEGIAPSVDPRTWTSDACAAFLKMIYDQTVPDDGAPRQHPWDGHPAALARVVAYLTARKGRGSGSGRPDNLKAKWITQFSS